MMFCDYQLFWHRHFERPALPRGFVISGCDREVMKDDGSIVIERQKSLAEIWNESGAVQKLRETMNQPSPLLTAMFKNKRK